MSFWAGSPRADRPLQFAVRICRAVIFFGALFILASPEAARADSAVLPSLAVGHAGAYILEDVVGNNTPVIDGATLTGQSDEWQFGFFDLRDDFSKPAREETPAEHAVYVIFRGTFGHLAGGAPQEGINYALIHAAIPAGNADGSVATTTVTLALSDKFGDPDTPSGSYSIMAAGLPEHKCVSYDPERGACTYAPYTTSDFLDWFASGSNEGDKFAPESFRSIDFEYVQGGKEPGCTENCFSNVLFLPGIKGSRLYRAADSCGADATFSSCADEEKLWEPSLSDAFGGGNRKIRELFLDQSGKSVRSDVYVKTDDVIDSAGGGDYYKSFMADMNALVADGMIADWKPVAYDWRLSLPDLLAGGAEVNGRISYTTATATPYIVQTLHKLANSSKSGKVTIVAHSNGGLVAKELLRELGDEEAAKLVDKLILVGVPQSGAPRALGALLYGYGESVLDASAIIPQAAIISKDVAREFAENSPTAYHLLPSQKYFDDSSDGAHPVGLFSEDDAYAKERAAYGEVLDSWSELKNFALAQEGGRAKPEADNFNEANILNSPLLDYAKATHDSLDSWTPPEGITVYQIAGWGLATVAGIEFYDLPASAAIALGSAERRLYRPIFFDDGDGVVPEISANADFGNAKTYWVNLNEYRKDNKRKEHADIFEISQLRTFVKNILKEQGDKLPEFIINSRPQLTEEKSFWFFLHSPLTLGIKDSAGNYTGLNEDGTISKGIDGIEYGQFGEIQYLIVPKGAQYTLLLNGLSTGTFTLDIQEVSGNSVTTSTTLTNVPTTENTAASLSILDSVSGTKLSVDENGDGNEDFSLEPKIGETIVYVTHATSTATSTTRTSDSTSSSGGPSSESSSSGGGGGGILNSPFSVGITVPTSATSTPSPATSTPFIATSTPPQPSAQIEIATTSTPIQKQVAPVGKVQGIATTTVEVEPKAQTASAFNAVSQQGWLSRISSSIYNFSRFWISRIYHSFK